MDKNQVKNYGFEKGCGNAPNKYLTAIKKEIYEAVGIKSYTVWRYRLKGLFIPRLDEAQKIEAVFAK